MYNKDGKMSGIIKKVKVIGIIIGCFLILGEKIICADILVDNFENGKLSGWKIQPLKRCYGLTHSLVKGRAKRSKYALRVSVDGFGPEPSGAWVIKYMKNVPGDFSSCTGISFWAKGDSQTTKLKINLFEEDGSCWSKQINLQNEWKKYVIPFSELRYDRGGCGRGKKNDHFRPGYFHHIILAFGAWQYRKDKEKIGIPHSYQIDEIYLIEEEDDFSFIDLRKVVNMGFVDEKADDKKGGWTDQGEKSLYGFPTGKVKFLDIPFEIINPKENNGKSCIVLYGKARTYFPEEVKIFINKQFKVAHFLQAAAWAGCMPKGTIIAYYIVEYEDKTKEYVPVKVGINVGDWCLAVDTDEARVAWNYNDEYGVFLYSWKNPHPEKKVKDIIFRSAKEKSIPILIGLTISSKEIKKKASKNIFIVLDINKKIGYFNPYVLGTHIIYFIDFKEDFKDGKIIKFLKQGGVRLLRYPGGEAAENFDWRINNVLDESFFPAHHLRNIKKSIVDTKYFLEICRRIGAKALLVVDVSSQWDKRINVSLKDNIKKAVEWVRYVKENGFQDVVWGWELGNEHYLGGGREKYVYQPVKKYVNAFLSIAKAMKKEDPSIRLGAVGPCKFYGVSYKDKKEKQEKWWPTLFKSAGKYIDFIILHRYLKDVGFSLWRRSDFYSRIIREFRQDLKASNVVSKRKKDIPIAFTEWGGSGYDEETFAHFVFEVIRSFVMSDKNVVATQWPLRPWRDDKWWKKWQSATLLKRDKSPQRALFIYEVMSKFFVGRKVFSDEGSVLGPSIDYIAVEDKGGINILISNKRSEERDIVVRSKDISKGKIKIYFLKEKGWGSRPDIEKSFKGEEKFIISGNQFALVKIRE